MFLLFLVEQGFCGTRPSCSLQPDGFTGVELVSRHVHQQKETELGDETATIQGLQESRTGSETQTDGTT